MKKKTNGILTLEIEDRNGCVVIRATSVRRDGFPGILRRGSLAIFDEFIPFLMAELSMHLTKRAPDRAVRAAKNEVTENVE